MKKTTNDNYRRTSLFAVLLFAVLTIHMFKLVPKLGIHGWKFDYSHFKLKMWLGFCGFCHSRIKIFVFLS